MITVLPVGGQQRVVAQIDGQCLFLADHVHNSRRRSRAERIEIRVLDRSAEAMVAIVAGASLRLCRAAASWPPGSRFT